MATIPVMKIKVEWEDGECAVHSKFLLEIVDRLVARRLTQLEWAENAETQGMHDWAARYVSVADAFTEAIDMLDVLISNSDLGRSRLPNTEKGGNNEL